MLIAITRPVSPSLASCALTHQERVPIDVERAHREHAAYEAALRSAGATVVQAPAAPDLPDAVFIEDTAVVLDEAAVIARPGAPSRVHEPEAIAPLLETYRDTLHLREPASLDGGDVLVLGRRVFVGLSSRTNPEGARQLGEALRGFGYTVQGVPVTGCLHLKSAVTEVADGVVLLNRQRVPPGTFADYERIDVDVEEPGAANALRIDGTVLVPDHYPRTAAILDRRGVAVRPVPCGELAKAEGGVTCCSLLFRVNEIRQ
ncbi:MAG: dimethylarginine dimethylaminohydrolase family protein [Gemmatimonadales bacterium]